METIYYNHLPGAANDIIFRTAEAISTDADAWGLEEIEQSPTFVLSVNSYCAIIGLNIFETIWLDMPREMSGDLAFETDEETSILPHAVKKATGKLKDHIETISGTEDWDIQWAVEEDKEYRIKIDPMELKDTLQRLVDFMEVSAKGKNKTVEFWL